jgi:chromosome segregation ATPase
MSLKILFSPWAKTTNHGEASTPVINSEVAKKREAFQKQLENTKKRMTSARAKYHQMLNSKIRLLERIERYDQQYHLLDTSQNDLCKESIDYAKRYSKLQKNKDKLLIQQKKGKERVQKLIDQISKEKEKCERYAHKQCELLRSLEDLAMYERTMYELDAAHQIK